MINGDLFGEEMIVLTPTARLARAELFRQNLAQTAAGSTTWCAPLVFEVSTWFARLREDYFLHSDDARIPISADQSLLLWQSVIEEEVWVGGPRVAELAAGVWRLIHEYGLDMPERWPQALMSDDALAMRTWTRQFLKLCADRGLVDEWRFAAELPSHIRAGAIALPETIRLEGFELAHTPLLEAVLEALESQGVTIERPEARDVEAQTWAIEWFNKADDELYAAAKWARSFLEEHTDARIAVVVPDLKGRVKAVERAFRQVFDPPGFQLAPQVAEPWHISLGLPLSQWPIVADALLLLGLSTKQISHPDAIRIVRSPFLTGALEEGRMRTHVLTRLSSNDAYWLSLRDLVYHANKAEAAHLAGCLNAWHKQRQQEPHKAMPSVWAEVFSKELKAIGYGHGRPLDSPEFQAWGRWHKLLEQFSSLDAVSMKPMSRKTAFDLLKERANNAVFRERDIGAPVEVLGVEEALGAEFDAVWVCTLDQEHWPATRQHHALIPPVLQSKVPSASTEACLTHAKAKLVGLARCAPVVRGSFTRMDGQGELSLLIPIDGEPLESQPLVASTPIDMEVLASDVVAPEANPGFHEGGTGLLQRQSDCPFKAFAVNRLGARERRHPRPGLTPAQRGDLVHRALQSLWTTIQSLSAWLNLSEIERSQAIEAAVATAFDQSHVKLSEEARRIERACLAERLENWLALESHRDAFVVIEREEKKYLTIGRLQLRGKIDRIDELEDGGSLLIDYKTGKSSSASHWLPSARMRDVQLPIYALNMDPPPVAVAFAKLRADGYGFSGLAEVETGMPTQLPQSGAKPKHVPVLADAGKPWAEHSNWRGLISEWQSHLESLADDFLNGHASVDPRAHTVCKNCHLKPLCRIQERMAGWGLEEEEFEDE